MPTTDITETDPDQGETLASGLLLRFVEKRDEPCPVCGYSLRALTEPRCPECGAPLKLQVGSPQIRVGAWALGIVSFALALGFDSVVSVLLVIALAASPAPVWQPYGLVTGFVALSAMMLGCLLWLGRARRSWNRRKTRIQWRWAISIFCGVGLLHVCFAVSLWLWLNP